MAMSDEQLLELTRTAIEKLTVGGLTSWTQEGHQFTRINLDSYWRQVETLEKRIARFKRGRFAHVRRTHMT